MQSQEKEVLVLKGQLEKVRPAFQKLVDELKKARDTQFVYSRLSSK